MDNNLNQSFEIVITRVFDVSRELVFKAWTELEHFAKWWGPSKSLKWTLDQGASF